MTDNIITSEVRFAFVNVFKPRRAEPGKEPKYGITLLFPLPSTLSGPALAEYEACMASLKAAAKAAAAEKWGDKLPPNLRSPFRDQADKAGQYEGYVPGALFLNVTSMPQPQVVDATVQPIIEPAKLYSGCYGRASLRAFAYDNSGNKGVSFGLQNVQKTRDGDSLAGRSDPSKEFKPIAVPAAAAAGGAPKLFD